MSYPVAIVKYKRPVESVRKAVELAGGFVGLTSGSKVFIKPNIVMWTKESAFPKWGIITTSQTIHDMVILLKEYGINDITIAEGMVTINPEDRDTPKHAFKHLGYGELKKRYGVKSLNIMERPFKKIAIDEETTLNFNADILDSDYVVNIPVLKTHSQTIVSLGIKNLKGLIDIPSRKKCHSADPVKDLHYMVSGLADNMPPMFTLIDGIYANERGPTLGGRAHRTNLLIASNDILSADKVGAQLLGWAPEKTPHLCHASSRQKREKTLEDIQITGEPIESAAVKLDHIAEYSQNAEGDWMPGPMMTAGITGVSFRKSDLTLCTYCTVMTKLIMGALYAAWDGSPFDRVDILTGKSMKPAKGMNKTLLIGNCMIKAHRNNPDIEEMIPVKGCPVAFDELEKGLAKAGINPGQDFFKTAHHFPALFLEQYKEDPDFDESFYDII